MKDTEYGAIEIKMNEMMAKMVLVKVN
jgi:hypothetical protein